MIKLAYEKSTDMPNAIPTLSYSIKKYKEIAKVLSSPINILKLPVIGESKIFKSSAERYGHVIIKLSLETDESITRFGGNYSYEWIPETTFVNETNDIVPLDNSFEKYVLDEIKVFVTLLEFLNENETPLRFSIIGGSYRIRERPYFEVATAEALIQLFKKLHE